MAESYDDLIFQLGDLAREHLADAGRPPRTMQHVFEMEDALVARREEIVGLEEDLNTEDADYQAFLEAQEAEKGEQLRIVTKWRSAVAGVEGRSRDLKKKMSTQKATYRYQKMSLKRAEEKHKDVELREGHDVKKITLSRENLKKMRLMIMRMQRDIEDMEYEFKQVLTPRPGQQGAAGILAHKRVLEMEDEAEERLSHHEERMKELEEALAQKDEDVKLAEQDLDGALFSLGEEVYGDRVAHAKLTPLYARVDKAK
jgi:hypothetical protein